MPRDGDCTWSPGTGLFYRYGAYSALRNEHSHFPRNLHCTATPIGVQHAYKRFHNTLQMLWGTANESHDMVPLPLDSKYTEDLFERLVVACEYSVRSVRH